MPEELKYATFRTGPGWLGLLASAKGLMRSTLPQLTAEDAYQLLGDRTSYAVWSPDHFHDLIEQLGLYLEGRKINFSDPLDLSWATEFQRQVLEATRLIAYGETRSYGWVAEQIGKPGAFRAVGQALSRNPLPIVIPCHRVLASQGKLGGYIGGIEMKRHLLYLETSAR